MRTKKREVPVYIMTGFLESGKTSFINDTVHQDYFRINGKTLIINCESGEEEYDEADLRKENTFVYNVEEQEDFNNEVLAELDRKYLPECVIIEFNPLWNMKTFDEVTPPDSWEIIQTIVTVDGSTFQVYRTNMRSLFGEMCKKADLVMINRCTEDMPLGDFRRAIKAANPATDVAFERTDHQMIDLFEDTVPYDLEADPIVIDDIDYGIFYIDLRDNPDRYRGKRVRFRGKLMKSRHFGSSEFVAGRMAMTCCAADTSFIGYVCIGKQAEPFNTGDYVEVTAKVDWKFRKEYRGKGPVLIVESCNACEPPESDMVYFN